MSGGEETSEESGKDMSEIQGLVNHSVMLNWMDDRGDDLMFEQFLSES